MNSRAIKLWVSIFACLMAAGTASAAPKIYSFMEPEIKIHDLHSVTELGLSSVTTTSTVIKTYATPDNSTLYILDSRWENNRGTIISMSVMDIATDTVLRESEIGVFTDINPDLSTHTVDGTKWIFGNRVISRVPGDNQGAFAELSPITVFDAETMMVAAELPIDLLVREMELSPDNSRLYIRGDKDQTAGDSSIRVYDTMTGSIINQHTYDRVITSIAEIDPSGNYLYMMHENGIRLMNTTTLETSPDVIMPVYQYGGSIEIGGDVILHVGQGGNDGATHIYNLSDYSLRATIPNADVSLSSVDSFDYDPNLNKLVLAGLKPAADFTSLFTYISVIDVSTGTIDSVSNLGNDINNNIASIHIIDDSVKLDLSVDGISASTVTCFNQTTGEQISFTPVEGENSWSCKAKGLSIQSGDIVTVSATGPIQ